MSREVRRVPQHWQHPRDDETGKYIPLLCGYATTAHEFETRLLTEGLQAVAEYYETVPNIENYMPEFGDRDDLWYAMYETVTEGTPISPAFETIEELARWLTDTGASAFGALTATYEQWLSCCKRGYAPSAVIDGTTLHSGVAHASMTQQP